MISKIKTFIKFDNRTKLDFIKAYYYCGVFRFVILFVPFKKIARIMGKSKNESIKMIDEKYFEDIKHISKVITLASERTLWESKCFVQALTAQKLLKNRGLSVTIYFGVKKDRERGIAAHAWTRCGQWYVTGGNIRDQYTIVGKFSN